MVDALKDYITQNGWYVTDTLNKILTTIQDKCEHCLEFPKEYRTMRKAIKKLRRDSRRFVKEDPSKPPHYKITYMLSVWEGEMDKLGKWQKVLVQPLNSREIDKIRKSAFLLHQVWHARCWAHSQL